MASSPVTSIPIPVLVHVAAHEIGGEGFMSWNFAPAACSCPRWCVGVRRRGDFPSLARRRGQVIGRLDIEGTGQVEMVLARGAR